MYSIFDSIIFYILYSIFDYIRAMLPGKAGALAGVAIIGRVIIVIQLILVTIIATVVVTITVMIVTVVLIAIVSAPRQGRSPVSSCF